MDDFISLIFKMLSDRSLFLPTLTIALIVISWSLMRPSMLKDDSGKRLAFRPVPRFLFAFICVSFYLLLFASFYAFPSYAGELAQQLSLGGLFKPPQASLGLNLAGQADAATAISLAELKARAPYFAVVAQALLFQLRFVREIESSIAIWLHSRRHLQFDIADFSNSLSEKSFVPTTEERNKNRAYVRKFGLEVTDLSLDAVGLVAFERWEKVATLVRTLKEWVAQDPNVLTLDEHKQIEQLEEAHDRKTDLAINIIKLVSDQGENAIAILGPEGGRAAAHRVPADMKLEDVVARAPKDVTDRSLSLSGRQLKVRLAQIQQFFDLEYADLLRDASALAARAIMLSKPALAEQRFQRLKASGFNFLGDLPRVSLDRMLAIFFAVAVPGFFIMFLANRGQAPAEALARFTTVMAIAALIGVSVGSRKSYAASEDLPWARYLLAGMLSSALFICVNWATFVLKQALHIQLLPTSAKPNLWQLATWSALPFLVTVTIAALGRRDGWSVPPRLHRWRSSWERALDGLALSVAVFSGFCFALMIHAEAGWPPPKGAEIKLDGLRNFLESFPWTLVTFGFLIGAFVVRDARKISHRTIFVKAKPASPPIPLAA